MEEALEKIAAVHGAASSFAMVGILGKCGCLTYYVTRIVKVIMAIKQVNYTEVFPYI